MSSSESDKARPVEADIVQADPGQADPGTQADPGNAGSLQGDPIKTLELKPYVIEALSTVYDPEIPVNIYELGLIC
jgi:hypothetical protein